MLNWINPLPNAPGPPCRPSPCNCWCCSVFRFITNRMKLNTETGEDDFQEQTEAELWFSRWWIKCLSVLCVTLNTCLWVICQQTESPFCFTGWVTHACNHFFLLQILVLFILNATDPAVDSQQTLKASSHTTLLIIYCHVTLGGRRILTPLISLMVQLFCCLNSSLTNQWIALLFNITG